jgi:hypothetical protein
LKKDETFFRDAEFDRTLPGGAVERLPKEISWIQGFPVVLRWQMSIEAIAVREDWQQPSLLSLFRSFVWTVKARHIPVDMRTFDRNR